MFFNTNLLEFFLSHKNKIYHLLGWTTFFGVQLMIIFMLRENFVIWHFLLPGLMWVIYFYINYLILLPRYLFMNKIATYFGIILLVSFIFYYTDSTLNEFIRKQKTTNTENTTEHNSTKKNDRSERKKNFPKYFAWHNVLLYFAGSTAIAFIDKWQLAEKEKKEIERENIGSELAYLKQQINPHFLFNSLNNIYSLAYRKSNATTDAILKLSSILRYMLYDTDKQHVALDKEIETIHNYIELQKLRLTDITKINFESEGNIGSHSIAPLLLIPLVENAFKYGSDNLSPSFIDIKLKFNTYGLSFVIKNKIVVKLSCTENSGIGLKNIKRRLELLYPNNHSFVIINNNDIFEVQMNLDNLIEESLK